MTYEQKHPIRVVAVIGFLLMLAAIAMTGRARGADIDAASCRVGISTKYCGKAGCYLKTIWGSGTLIAKDRVLTCSHLFDEGDGKKFVVFAGKEYPFVLMKRDAKADLALLYVEGVPVEPTGWNSILDKSCVFALTGYGGGEYRKVSGTFNRWTGFVDGRHSFYVNGRNRQGDSGGGVFDSRGLLVGVAWGTSAEVPEVAVTSGEPLINFLWGK